MAQPEQAEGDAAFVQRSRDAVERLAARYGWRLEPDEAAALARDVAAVHAGLAGVEADPSARSLEQTCCRLRFVRLHAGLAAGGSRADAVLEELFQISPPAEAGASARYGGYLFRSALGTLHRWLAGNAMSLPDVEELACDAAGRAVTTVRNRFRDCRDPDAFWGWTSRVAERAAIDELRSGRAAGGRSVHARSLDELQEAAGDAATASRETAGQAEDRHVDAIAVRTEFVRKCRLGKLSPDQREALVRSFWGGEKPQEIAAALAAERGSVVTAAQVSLWKHRGLQIMEANLREHGFS